MSQQLRSLKRSRIHRRGDFGKGLMPPEKIFDLKLYILSDFMCDNII